MSGDATLFTTRTFVEVDAFGFADKFFARDKTIDFGLIIATVAFFSATAFFFNFGWVFDLATVFVFNFVMVFWFPYAILSAIYC